MTQAAGAAQVVHRLLSLFRDPESCRRSSLLALTSEGGLPYKPARLETPAIPNTWRFSGAEMTAPRHRSIGNTPATETIP